MKKKKTLTLFLTVCLLTIAISSCNKDATNSQAPATPEPQVTPELIAKIQSDSDWHTIANANVNLMDKLVLGKVDTSKIDIANEQDFLSAIHMSKADYLEQVVKVKSAASRMLAHYNHTDQMTINGQCITCADNLQQKVQEFKNLIVYYQQNPQEYNDFRLKLLEDPSRTPKRPTRGGGGGTTGGGGGGVPCCGFDFYLCCAVCAATIEAFPVYLACCYLCAKSFCC